MPDTEEIKTDERRAITHVGMPQLIVRTLAPAIGQTKKVVPVLDKAIEKAARVPDIRHTDTELEAIMNTAPQGNRDGGSLAVDDELFGLRQGFVRIIGDIEADIEDEFTGSGDSRSLECGQAVDLQERVVAS